MSPSRDNPDPRKHHNWRRYEERALTRYARWQARGRFRTALEAASACRAELAGHGLVRSVEAVRRRMRDRRDELDLATRNTWWIPAEDRVLERHARALAAHRVRPLSAAVAACRRDLEALHRRFARENPGHPLAGVDRPASSVERKLRLRALAIDPGWNADRWSAAETMVAERFARAVVAGRYASSEAAARACSARLAGARLGPKRTLQAVTLVVNKMVRGLGLRRMSSWTPAQDRVVERYALDLARGHHASLLAAARACAAELARAAGPPRRPGADEHRHSPDSVISRIDDRLRELRLPFYKSAYLPEEERVVDRFARAVVAGRYESVRAAATPCVDELRKLHRALARRAGVGLASLPGRRWEGVNTRLSLRCRELGRRRETYFRWAGWELALLRRWLRWYRLWHDRRPKWALGDATTGLMEALAARGSHRSRGACKTALVASARKLRTG